MVSRFDSMESKISTLMHTSFVPLNEWVCVREPINITPCVSVSFAKWWRIDGENWSGKYPHVCKINTLKMVASTATIVTALRELKAIYFATTIDGVFECKSRNIVAIAFLYLPFIQKGQHANTVPAIFVPSSSEAYPSIARWNACKCTASICGIYDSISCIAKGSRRGLCPTSTTIFCLFSGCLIFRRVISMSVFYIYVYARSDWIVVRSIFLRV